MGLALGCWPSEVPLSADILSLCGENIATLKQDVDENIVAKLERFLCDAKSGKLRAIAICAITDDLRVHDDFYIGKGQYTILGALQVLSAQITRSIEDE